jgi:hypothetical protein
MNEQNAAAVPSLLTPGRIAAELGVPLHRVVHILGTRSHITPRARAGTLRLYCAEAVAQVRHELNAQDARRSHQREAIL